MGIPGTHPSTPRPAVVERVIRRLVDSGPGVERGDSLVVEEPLEIRLGDVPIAVVMRTPDDDVALAVGFLFSEGILRRPEQVLSVEFCRDVAAEAEGNVVRVIAEGADLDAAENARRQIYASSSCGICGKTTLDAVRLLAPPLAAPPALSFQQIVSLPGRLLAAQSLFAKTGGLHAAGLVRPDGTLELVREDIGRHNACDKILGTMAMREDWPLAGRAMIISGRASFEMVQKAAMGGIACLIAVSAPSSLAVDYAREAGMTLLGFVREGSLNVYAGEIR